MSSPARNAAPEPEPPGRTAERALLGACLIRGRLDAVPPELRADDFGYEPHRLIYRTMLALEADEMSVEYTVVESRLSAGGMDLSGLTYLASLMGWRLPSGIAYVPDLEAIPSYARETMEAAGLRRRRAWGR